LAILLDQPNSLFADSITKFDWKNDRVIKTGLKHQCTDNFLVLTGYFFDKFPVSPNEGTYLPLIPDGDHHVFEVGAMYSLDDYSFSLPSGILQTVTGSKNSAQAGYF